MRRLRRRRSPSTEARWGHATVACPAGARDRRRGRADEPGNRVLQPGAASGPSNTWERRRTRRSAAPPEAGRRPSSTRVARPARTGCSRCAPPPPMRPSCTGGSRSPTGRAAGLRAVRTGHARLAAESAAGATTRPSGRSAERAARRVRGDRDDAPPETSPPPGSGSVLNSGDARAYRGCSRSARPRRTGDDRGQVLLGRSGASRSIRPSPARAGTRAVGGGRRSGHRDAAVRVDPAERAGSARAGRRRAPTPAP